MDLAQAAQLAASFIVGFFGCAGVERVLKRIRSKPAESASREISASPKVTRSDQLTRTQDQLIAAEFAYLKARSKAKSTGM